MDTYFVIMADGQKYGPADVPTLSLWALQDRLFPHSILESSKTGVRSAASTVTGISWNLVPAPKAKTSAYQSVTTSGVPVPWVHRQYASINMALLVLISTFLALPVFVFALVAFITCENPDAKKKALFSLIISASVTTLFFAFQLLAPKH